MVIIGFIEYMLMLLACHWFADKKPSDRALWSAAKAFNDITDIFERLNDEKSVSE